MSSSTSTSPRERVLSCGSGNTVCSADQEEAALNGTGPGRDDNAVSPVCPAWTRFTDRWIHKAVPQAVLAMSLGAVRRPKTCIVACVSLALLLIVIGLATNFSVNVDTFEVFAPDGVRPASHRAWIENESGFPESSNMFVLLIHADGENVLGKEGVRRVFEAFDTVRETPGYQELCAQSTHVDPKTENKTCKIFSATRFWYHDVEYFENVTTSDKDAIETLSSNSYPGDSIVEIPVDTNTIIGGAEWENGTLAFAESYTSAFLLPPVDDAPGFEEAALDRILRLQQAWIAEEGNSFRVEVLADRSYEDEFQRAIYRDLPLILFVVLLMVSFTALVFFRRDKVQSRVLLAFGSVGTIATSLMTSYGLMFICGVPFTNMTMLVPFVVFGVGLDDTFIITSSFSRTHQGKIIEERIRDTMEDVGLSISVTTVTTAFAFGLGTISSIPAVRWLCLYAMLSIVIDFIYQITLFVAILVLDERRVQANRRDICFCYTVPEEQNENSEVEGIQRDVDPDREQRPSFFERFMVWYADQLLRPWVKAFVIVGFTALLGACAYSASKLRQEFVVTELVPNDSYILGFYHSYQDYSSQTMPIYAYFRHVDQFDNETQQQMIKYTDDLAELKQFGDEPFFCWIRDFNEYQGHLSTFLQNMTFAEQAKFLFNYPEIKEIYGEDVVLNEAGNITASRCLLYVSDLDLNVVQQQIDLLKDQRAVTAAQPVNQNRADWAFFTYDDLYLTWEFYDSVVGEWLFTAIAGVVAVTVVGFLCIPHWSATFFVFPLITILYIDLIGTIQFSGLYINVVTHISLAMSIGLLVDYIMHVLLRYYESPGKTRDEKVKYTLRTLGSPILIGAISTFLGVLPLAFSTSSIMRTVFVCFLAMVTLGAGHGLIFLPVLLSIVGPNPKPKEKKKSQMASVGDVFAVVRECGLRTQFLFVTGCIASVLNGAIYPAIAFIFASALSSFAGASTNLDQVREVSFMFLILGAYAFVTSSVQTACLELVATKASRLLRLRWFEALLRQDAAFFDVHSVSSISSTIEPSANVFRLGLGRKLGEGIQFSTAFVGGMAFAFFSSWRLALVIIAVLPVSVVSAYVVVTVTQKKNSRAQDAYASAGSVAYSTVSSIRTILSLNAIKDVTSMYSKATKEALKQSVAGLWKEGLATGCMIATFMLIHFVLTLFGSYLIYDDVRKTGCDPSGSVDGNDTCNESGASVFGAMLGVVFGSLGIPAVSNFIETFTASRVALGGALHVINRKVGDPEVEIYETIDDGADGDLAASKRTHLKAILPPYLIDSSSRDGLKLENVKGTISFEHVSFYYPTRPKAQILSNFNLEIEAGKTLAIVGHSGCGKSTVLDLIERFYDPVSGSVKLDGVDLKDLNVKHLRSLVGYVGQEPLIFATTIAENIRYGMPNATQEKVEEAAKIANAHEFIMSFPDGYNTHCGDSGAQLSGGQRQRLAIARALVANPQILLLDESTSALDSESELAVQRGLSEDAAESGRTTVVVAHRLSTIRNADSICYVANGQIVEQGSHDELMSCSTGYYRSLVEKQEANDTSSSSSLTEETHPDEVETTHFSDMLDLGETDLGKMLGGADETPLLLKFRDVKFAYPTRPEKLVLNNFNLDIHLGETVALCSPSGGGKSTVLQLIERFYDPIEGIVEFKDVDIRELSLAEYRGGIGYVGQEPVLFDTTISGNISLGAPNASQQDIEEAARMANAHEFIVQFPDGYHTVVGEKGAQLSGGQKQRIAIARAWIKRPSLLLLDEATSSLDVQSERAVQETLDKLMADEELTVLVIAHRLSTIQNADRLVHIENGTAVDVAENQQLMDYYKRLLEYQSGGSPLEPALTEGLSNDNESSGNEYEKTSTPEDETEEASGLSMKRALRLASPDWFYILLGVVGALMVGCVFPFWGILLAAAIDLLFRRVEECTFPFFVFLGFRSCQDYWNWIADDMQDRSFEIAVFWASLVILCIAGVVFGFLGFGTASERLTKRMRDSAFASLARQEVGFFDKRSVGHLTSQLEDDTARVHRFTGEPLRSSIIAICSVLVGVIVAMVYMWPFALLSLGLIPIMGFATQRNQKVLSGRGEQDGVDGLSSPSAIVVDSLLNIRTVATLTLEDQRYKEYEEALSEAVPVNILDGFKSGLMTGSMFFIQQGIMALLCWWGGWLLFNYSDIFEFADFLICVLSLQFSLYGLGLAFQGLSDRKETTQSVERIFYLLDRKPKIE